MSAKTFSPHLFSWLLVSALAWVSEWVKALSRVQLFATPWTVAYQALLSMGFSRQGCWIGLPFPSPQDLPDPGIEPWSPTFQADALTSDIPACKVVSDSATPWTSLPGSSVHGISQARILEWVAISFSRGSFPPRDGTCVSYISCIFKWVLYH